MRWLEKTILHGVTIDKQWTKLDTGHQVTVFDLVDNVEGGIREETREVIKHLRDIYQILFLRKDVQLALDNADRPFLLNAITSQFLIDCLGKLNYFRILSFVVETLGLLGFRLHRRCRE